MALLLTCFDTGTIRLVDRWLRNTMLRYLHITAKSFTQGLAARIVQFGTYTLIPPEHVDL